MAPAVEIDLNKPMDDIRAELSKYPVSTRLSLSGKIIVARDIAHSKFMERYEAGQGLPDYIKNHIIYYAGPAKTPDGQKPQVPSAPPRPAAWTPMSPSSRKRAAP
jgi:fumarate hydratase class I